MAEATAHRDSLEGDVNCLKRLACDERMAEAFALLAKGFTDDAQWRYFIYTAWASRMDFAKYRDRLKRAEELKSEIADAAEKLAKKIGQFAETGTMGPDEFYSIPVLLRQTDNCEMQNHNLHMWRSMRHHVLGDPPRRNISDAKAAKLAEAGAEYLPGVKIIVVAMDENTKIDTEEEARNMLRYAWGTSPYFSALLGTMAKAARAFKPGESGMIGAAIQSRQKNPKTEYLRAFGSHLTNTYNFQLTPSIMNAMAIVATVVINLPDVVVTYDDVRKALPKLGDNRSQNQGEK